MDRIAIEKSFDANRDRYMKAYFEALRFPSVSAEEVHDEDCRACAEWLKDYLAAIGFQARLVETDTKPLVFAKRAGAADKPVVLLYGHYDVQPADPVQAWTTPPFEPQLRGDRVYARGAEDNKGQLMASLFAVEELIRQNSLGVTLKVLIEGEEENGSESTTDALPGLADLLKADILLAHDTGTVAPDVGTIVMGLRGMVHVTVELGGPTRDLHSGAHGGRAPNPATAMARLLATLHDEDGSVAVEGFYDDVTNPTDAERDLAVTGQADGDTYERQNGVPSVAGEKGVAPAERTAFRPCIDVNGVHSGYGGEGCKTIIPARAMAKISARLVPDQDPGRCLDAIVAHLERHAPDGLKLTITDRGAAGRGFRLSLDSPVVAGARGVLARMYGKEPVMQWEGASIPVISLLSEVSGAEPLLVGFALPEDKAHAVDESFSLGQFRNGYIFSTMLLGGF